MLMNFFSKMIGSRKPLLNSDNLFSYVEILSWCHPVYSPAHHLALRVVRNNREVAFLSFYPIVLEGTSEKSLTEQRVGAEAFFIENYRDETLLQGFKNSWPNIKTDLAREHITINYDSLVRVSDKQLLADAKTFPSRVQEKLRIMASTAIKFNSAVWI
jgi:hypothetical protein